MGVGKPLRRVEHFRYCRRLQCFTLTRRQLPFKIDTVTDSGQTVTMMGIQLHFLDWIRTNVKNCISNTPADRFVRARKMNELHARYRFLRFEVRGYLLNCIYHATKCEVLIHEKVRNA